MLYDQAQIALACVEAARLAGDAGLFDVARDTLDYVRRDMTAESGGFFSAEDADSVPEGAAPGTGKAEGACYVWSDAELTRLAGEDAEPFRRRYGIGPEGNAPADPHGEFGGANLLHVAQSVDEVARALGMSPAEAGRRIERARGVLFEARQKRPRPLLDDKILTGWNGLMMAAFARGARFVAGHSGGEAGTATADRFLDSARRSAQFVRRHLWQPDGVGLLRRFRDGEAAVRAFAEDYASLIFGLLELAEADPDPVWLAWALELQDRCDRLFWDEREGGWFATDGADASVLVRLKDDYDGAEPAASSLGACNLVTLARLTGDSRHLARLDTVLAAFAGRLEDTPRAMPMMLLALSARLTSKG